VLPSAHRGTGNGIAIGLNRIMGIISAVIATAANVSPICWFTYFACANLGRRPPLSRFTSALLFILSWQVLLPFFHSNHLVLAVRNQLPLYVEDFSIL
jgi:hypothetical protein